MSGPVTYSHKDSIAVVRMDDGKVNALGPTMQQALNEAIDQADRDNVGALVLTGNERVFSGGFDLKILTSGEAQPAIDMLRGGFELAYRLLSYPKPVVMACTGHAIAMGAFLLFSCDYRVGAAGPYKLMANEVALGLTFPHCGATILRSRLTPSAYRRATLLSEQFSPDNAVETGFLDRVVPAEEVHAAARDVARAATMLDLAVFARSRERLCGSLADELYRSIEADAAALV